MPVLFTQNTAGSGTRPLAVAIPPSTSSPRGSPGAGLQTPPVDPVARGDAELQGGARLGAGRKAALVLNGGGAVHKLYHGSCIGQIQPAHGLARGGVVARRNNGAQRV